MLCRFAATAFSVLLKQFRNGSQRFVHLLSSSKFACNVRFKDDDIGPFRISCSVLTTHAFAEVIFRSHRVIIFRRLPSSLLLHSFSVQPVLLVVHL